MRVRVILLLACAIGSAVSSSGATARETTAFVEYLYVEPNTGGSSGGHAAVCLAEACYHFQQIDGSIRLQRERPENLDFDYRVLGNRTVNVSRIAVAEETKRRLRDTFDRRLWTQERHFENLDERVRDRRLLQWVRARSERSLEASPVRLPASGYLVRDQSSAGPWWRGGAPRSDALADLARQIGAAQGGDFLDRRAAALRSAMAELEPSSAEEAAAPEADTFAPAARGFAARYRELASGLLALEILRAAPALQAEAVLRTDDADFRLTPREIETLRRHAARLEAALVRLASSRRSDWGYPFLIGMARLLAIEESVRSGSLVLLDVFAEDAASIPAGKVGAHARTLALVREERRADFLRLRGAFFAAEEPGEARLSMLELAANLYVEVGRGLEEGAPIRLPGASPLPERSARRRDWPWPTLSQPALDAALAATRRREASYRQELERLYRYDLLERNCVTELFRTIEGALVADGADAESLRALAAASRRELGGYVDWRGDLNFVPFVSQRSVRAEYRLATTEERASYRRSALREMYGRENDVRVGLRESNVLTARAYERNEDDPLFLFFTDDALLRRPLYGAVNLAVGVGGVIAGAVLLPFDRGKTLRAGLDGVLYSVPELALISVRKGTFAFAPRQWSREGPPPPALTQSTISAPPCDALASWHIAAP